MFQLQRSKSLLGSSMNIKFARFIVMIALLSATLNSYAAPQLYETGPSEESAYIRFVNLTEQVVKLSSANSSTPISLGIQPDNRASQFFSVKSGTKLSAMLTLNGQSMNVDAIGKPWEYLTIVVLDSKNVAHYQTKTIHESPNDFSALRASIALYNTDESCANASLKVNDGKQAIFESVVPFSPQRRLVNPIALHAMLSCGARTEANVAIAMQAGGRYSIFNLNNKASQRAFVIRDVN